MKIAVFVCGDRFVAAEREHSLGGLPRIQPDSLYPVALREGDPLYIMRILHGVGYRTDPDSYDISLALDNRHVLFGGGIGGVGAELLHGLVAANRDYATVVDYSEQVATNIATDEFYRCHVYFLLCIGGLTVTLLYYSKLV